MRRRRNPEIIAGRVNADGSIAAGDGFTVQRTGLGAYVITFGSGFRLISGTATAGAVAFAGLRVTTPGTLNVFGGNTSSGASLDTDFTFVAVGVQQ
jgi:hypothetical protein